MGIRGEVYGIISDFIGAMLVNNFVLSQFLGICSFIGVSKKKDAAVGMGLAVTFVMVLASIISWLVYNLVLDKFNITYLKTIVFVLVIASLVQFVEMVVKKYSPSLYKALGIFFTLNNYKLRCFRNGCY